MSEKFQGKYRNESLRLQKWDYGWKGSYFITICTKARSHYFGEIKDKKMQWSPIGSVADVLWHEIKHHAQDVELGEFVVMPNHIHGIITLTRSHPHSANHSVGPGHALGLPSDDAPDELTPGQKRFQNQGKNSISAIVGGYKSAVTKHIRRLGFDFAWQSRFYDHIIRDQESYQRIENYIRNNPANWADDKFY